MKFFDQKYFSLIELLVTVSMLLLIFSLLSPSLKNMLSRGSMLSCKGNLSHIARVKSVYLEDYDQAYHFIREPLQVFSVKPWSATHKRWYNILEDEYMAAFDKSFTCPESYSAYTSNENKRISYGFNFIYMGNNWIWRWYKVLGNDARAERARVYSDQIKSPSKQIVYADANREGVTYWNHDYLRTYDKNASSDYSPVARHTNHSSNFSFADAHVENLLYEEVAFNEMRKIYWDLRE